MIANGFVLESPRDNAMTTLRKPIKRELPEPVARRKMVVELHPGFIRFREKRSRTAWDISWESVYWRAAEIQARRDAPIATSTITLWAGILNRVRPDFLLSRGSINHLRPFHPTVLLHSMSGGRLVRRMAITHCGALSTCTYASHDANC